MMSEVAKVVKRRPKCNASGIDGFPTAGRNWRRVARRNQQTSKGGSVPRCLNGSYDEPASDELTRPICIG